jgi:hypothetical protein
MPGEVCIGFENSDTYSIRSGGTCFILQLQIHMGFNGNATYAALEVKKLSTKGAKKDAEAKVAVTEGVTNPKGTPRRSLFANFLNCPDTHTAWRFKAFAKLALEEKDRIILDNKMYEYYSFCLLYRAGDLCYGRGTDM